MYKAMTCLPNDGKDESEDSKQSSSSYRHGASTAEDASHKIQCTA